VVAALVLTLAGHATSAQPQDRTGPYRLIAIAEDERRYADGELKRFLAHQDPAVRSRAALAVGRLQDSTTVPDLVPLLHDRSEEVRREAVFALGQIGHRSARLPLEELLSGTPSGMTELVIEALGKISDRASTSRIIPFLQSASPPLRGEAAVALWRLADSTALEPLITCHLDSDPEMRWRVLYALEKIVAPARVVSVAARHLEDPEWLTRAYAVRTLGRQRSAQGTPDVLRALDDREVAVVVNALRALQQIGDTTCAPCLNAVAGVLRRHSHPYVRATAATVLAERSLWMAADSAARPGAIQALTSSLEDSDAATRGAAAAALLTQRGDQALAEIRTLLSDSSIYTRAAVLRGLARVSRVRVDSLLRARARLGAPLVERLAAVEVLGALRAHDATPLLRAGLADTSALFAAASAAALAELADSASVPSLARAYAAHARDADADARISLRDALRTLAGPAFADSLERAHAILDSARHSYPADFHRAPMARAAVIRTTAGDIEWSLYRQEAPQTVKNFVRLARRGYFAGVPVHRVVPNFVIQDGDPTGTGSGGPGYSIRCEYNRLRYDAGMVGMALSGKDTGGSQWFITHSPQPHLNGRYTIFARVTRGMEVVHRMVQGDRVLEVEILE
jgi:cyclophilin family peptidyl-prolyl cis-trans isomerase/HEAT repeat protein